MKMGMKGSMSEPRCSNLVEMRKECFIHIASVCFNLNICTMLNFFWKRNIPVVPTLMYLYYKLAYQIVKSAEHSDVYTIVVLCPLHAKRSLFYYDRVWWPHQGRGILLLALKRGITFYTVGFEHKSPQRKKEWRKKRYLAYKPKVFW